MQLNVFTKIDNIPKGINCDPILLTISKYKNLIEDSNNPIFQKYLLKGNTIFNNCSLKEAELVVLPINWERALTHKIEDRLIDLIEIAKEANVLSISFFGGDCSHFKLEKESDLMFRHSLYASTRARNDFAYPAWSEDILSEYFHGELPVKRDKSIKPIVGFCGFSKNNLFENYLKFFLHKTEKYLIRQKVPRYHIGHVFRNLSLSKLWQSPLIKDNFIIRKQSFFTNNKTVPKVRKNQKYEFIKNLLDSDYIFCCRGSGNYSFRFYEALSCGRIPIFLNTDCVLPYDFEIDWKKYCVWVEESELPFIADKVAEFHDKLSTKEFVDLQYQCRKIWEKWISPEGFYSNLYRHIEQL